MRATTGRPSFFGDRLALVITRAAAPSEMEEALAAVIVPSLAKAGRRRGILAGSALGRLLVLADGLDALAGGDLRPASISAAKAPDAWAALARVRLSMAKASITSRVNW